MGSARTSSVLVRSKSDRRVAFGAVDHAAIAGSNAKAKIFMLFRDNFLAVPTRWDCSHRNNLFVTTQASKKDLENPRRCVSPPSGATTAWQCFVW
jgi:hypothetical protein